MPFRFLQNVTPTSFLDTFFQWKKFMVTPSSNPTSPGPGWSVVASSNGSSYSASDNISSAASLGAKAWFILKPPSQTRSFCFQRDVGANTNFWRIKYSFGGFNLATATATQTPPPNASGDEVILYGSGTDALPGFSNVFNGLPEKKYVFQSGADDSSSAFYFFAYPASKLAENNSSAKLMMIHDPLAVDGYASEDTDPSVTGVFNDAGAGNNILELTKPANYSGQFFWGSMKKIGSPTERVYVNFSIASYGAVNSSNAFTMSSNQVVNPHSFKQDLFPCMYFCKNNTYGFHYNGFKGYSSFVLIGTAGVKNGHFFTLNSTKDKVMINGFALPWNGSYLLA